MKAKLGSGERFKALADEIMNKENYSHERAAAIAASIGRKKYGKKKFQKLAAKGKKG